MKRCPLIEPSVGSMYHEKQQIEQLHDIHTVTAEIKTVGRWEGNSYGQMSSTDSTKYSRQRCKPCLSEIRSATTSPENNYGNLNVAFVDGH